MVDNFVDGLSGYLHGSFLLSYLAVYLGGVLISFTPCVYPVLPITAAFIGAHGSGSRGRGVLLSLIYVLGMAVTYTLLGAIAALSGKLFGQIQASHWTSFFIGNLCILMALSMMDVFTIPVRMPEFVMLAQTRE